MGQQYRGPIPCRKRYVVRCFDRSSLDTKQRFSTDSNAHGWVKPSGAIGVHDVPICAKEHGGQNARDANGP
jgi:hypothetical protein